VWPLKNVPPKWQRLLQIPNQRRPPQCHLNQRDPRQLHDVVVQVYVWDQAAGFCSVLFRHARSCTCCKSDVYHRLCCVCLGRSAGGGRVRCN
jgi:hypothetical protein